MNDGGRATPQRSVTAGSPQAATYGEGESTGRAGRSPRSVGSAEISSWQARCCAADSAGGGAT